jgi:hypothetical protein
MEQLIEHICFVIVDSLRWQTPKGGVHNVGISSPAELLPLPGRHSTAVVGGHRKRFSKDVATTKGLSPSL